MLSLYKVFYWWKLVAAVLVTLYPSNITAEVVLVSSVEQDGRAEACPGELVIFTCTVTQGLSLNWASAVFTCDNSPSPTFVFAASTSAGDNVSCGNYQANLTSIFAVSAVRGNLSSTLTPTAPTSPGAIVTCSDPSDSQQQSKPYPSIAGLPSPPQNPTPSIHYGPHNITIVVQWDYPQSDGGTPVDNYTVSRIGPGAVHLSTTTSVQAMTTFTLDYNEEYTVSIVATNCAGTGGTVSLNISEAGCGVPAPPANGSIIRFASAAVGSQLLYSCDPGFIPVELMNSTCASDLSWSPNPAEFTCREPVSCSGPPLPPINGSIGVYTSAVEGSMVAFSCNEGLIPEGRSNTTCASNGSWTPNPADLICIERPPEDEGSGNGDGTGGSLVLQVAIPAVVVLLLVVVVVSVVITVVVLLWWRQRSGAVTKKVRGSADTSSEPLELHSPLEDKSNEANGIQTGALYSIVQATTSSKLHKPGLMYAELGPDSQEPKIQRPPSGDNVGVQYSSVRHGEAVIKTAVHPADKSLDLDNLLVQLQNVPISKWYQLGEGLGVPADSLNKITTSFPSAPDQCKVEMLDLWLRNHTRGGQATWREVAEALTRIHEDKLANALMGVYTTGTLPVLVDMRSLPRSPCVMDDPPPPVPPKYFSEEDDFPPSPKRSENGGPHQNRAVVPPRPPKSSREGAAPPPRPPKSSKEGATFPPRPPKSHHEIPRHPPKANQEDTTLPPRPAKSHQQSAQQPGPVAPPRPPKSHSRGPPSDAPPRPPKPGSS